MRRRIGIASLASVAIIACLLVYSPQSLLLAVGKSRDKVYKLKDPKFTFKLRDLDGNDVSSSDDRFKDKVILFDIWGTWCPPCRALTPILNGLHEKYASKGLEVVGAAFEYSPEDGEDPAKKVAGYVSKHDIEYLMLYGGAAEHPSALIFSVLPFKEFDGFPTVVIVGKDGIAKRVEEGYDEQTTKRLETIVKELLDLD